MGMMSEFKDFAMRGNLIDMAVGVVLGGAFGAVTKAFVGKIVMPLVGLIGGTDFSQYNITIKDAVMEGGEEVAAAVQVGIGDFATAVVDFIIIAFAVFLVIKAINAAKKKEPAPAPAPTEKACPSCCTNIPIKATRCPNCTSEISG